MSSYPVLVVLKIPRKPQELHDDVERKFRSKFEIVPRGMELIEKIRFCGDIDGVTAYVIYFTKLAIAELFIHFDFPVVTTGPKQRMFDNPDVPYYQNAFSSMVASTRLVYVEGGGVSDMESHVQATLEDATHGSGLFFKWTKSCSNNCWFMELVSKELADLLVYRCNKQREGLFLFRVMDVGAPPVVVTEVKPVAFASPTILKPRDPRRTLLASQVEVDLPLAPQAPADSDLGMQIVEAPNMRSDGVPARLPSPMRTNKSAAFQTQLFLLVNVRTPEVEIMLHLAMRQVMSGITPAIVWIDERRATIRMGSELEADMFMDVFLERTMDFFNDPPMRVYRHSSYRRPGRSRVEWEEDAPEDERKIIIKGFPPRLHHLPAKAAISELLSRAIGATKMTVTNFLLRYETITIVLRSVSAVEDVLEHREELVLCGRTLTVERGRTVHRYGSRDRENRLRLSRSNTRDRDDTPGRRRPRSNSRDRTPRSRSRDVYDHHHEDWYNEVKRHRYSRNAGSCSWDAVYQEQRDVYHDDHEVQEDYHRRPEREYDHQEREFYSYYSYKRRST